MAQCLDLLFCFLCRFVCSLLFFFHEPWNELGGEMMKERVKGGEEQFEHLPRKESMFLNSVNINTRTDTWYRHNSEA